MPEIITPLAVCLSIARIHGDHYYTQKEIYDIVRLNFANASPNLVTNVSDYLDARVPEWKPWLREEKYKCQNQNGGILWVWEYMKEGGFSRELLPEHECTFEGLKNTLAALIGLSRRWAVGQGLSRRRSFNRSREGDAGGYMSTSEYPWYDHPGNLGY